MECIEYSEMVFLAILVLEEDERLTHDGDVERVIYALGRQAFEL